MPPNASDIEGGGKFVNRCDDFIVIHRYIFHPTGNSIGLEDFLEKYNKENKGKDKK